MFRKGINNYFKNMLYIFVPMGILYLFVILVTYGSAGKIFSLLAGMFENIAVLIDHSVTESGTAVQDFLEFAMGQINWNDSFPEVIEQITSTNWLENTVRDFLLTLDISVEGFTENFNIIVNNFVDDLKLLVILASSVILLGVGIASWATEYFVRRKTAKRNIKQIILNWVLEPLFLIIYTFIMVWLATVIKGYAILVFVLLAIVHEILSLSFSWIIYRDKTLKFRKVVNFKNIALCFATALIIIAVDVIVFMLLSLVSMLIAVLIIVPLAIYSLKILETNADSYIVEMVNESKAKVDGEAN